MAPLHEDGSIPNPWSPRLHVMARIRTDRSSRIMRAISWKIGKCVGIVRWMTLRVTSGFVVQTNKVKCFASHRILINGQVPAVVHTVGKANGVKQAPPADGPDSGTQVPIGSTCCLRSGEGEAPVRVQLPRRPFASHPSSDHTRASGLPPFAARPPHHHPNHHIHLPTVIRL